ncbi:LuxR C-terminal-related transcriptional regulator [Streptomyces sp. J2-1]|uniref:TrmB family transcriptional regulator n=1 Tax=Streptomyces corallincola TaxID=2851888 RepID=UPI001C3850E8|nr:TrmB family transcriptional regulator [Streptomyces corallincola]MBV2353925.1 LuxR C-terminal-related transcriptional regulator [Streptomyces corallincola]
MLDVLGVRPFDERVYRALLAHPGTTVAALAGAVDGSSGQVAHALRRLAGHGLVQHTGPGRWEATGPRTAVTALLNQRRTAVSSALSEAESGVDALHELYLTGRLHTDPSRLVEVLSGRDAVVRRVGELSRSVRTHLWILDRPPYLSRPDGRPHDDSTETAVTRSWLERGVDIRSVYCPESMSYPGRFETILRLTALGEQARMLDRLPLKLHIVDRRAAIVPLAGSLYDSVAVVHPSGLLDALIELFEAHWRRAQPLAAPGTPGSPAPAAAPGASPVPGAAADTPTAAELLLLRMLHSGLKDQAIARQLGISTRTATRRVAALMHRLGAGTRFQAGANARSRGWLEP